jgi:hypothetical protein
MVRMVAVFTGRVPRCKSQITKRPELRFRAVVGYGTSEVRFERAAVYILNLSLEIAFDLGVTATGLAV